MDDGVTTVGSIVGKLKMDASDWFGTLDRAEARAREISNTSPTIRVDADIAAAMAKIEALKAAQDSIGSGSTTSPTAPRALPATNTTAAAAGIDRVTAAERRLAAAEAASEAATTRATIAEMRLEERRDGHKMTAAQLAAAEFTVAEAVRRSESAAERATIAETALAEAQEKAAKKALEQAAANEVAEKSTVKANEANKTSVSRFGMIATAVGTILPMLVPLAAFAVGGAGALTMMGVAGVFAVVGIKREMERGSAVGDAYANGLRSLRRDMSALSSTSANQFLSSFRGIVADTNAAMPMLNRQVGFFSGLLGRSSGNLVNGALTGLRVLEPLLLTVGVYVESLTAKFAAWTGNGGLERFASYAQSTLPQVVDVLAALGSAVMHILEALAPLGSVGLVILTGVSQAINGIPVDALTTLITALTYGTLAFKAWGFVAPMLARVAGALTMTGAAATIATGPIGWIIAGVGALAAVLVVATMANQGATKATGEYTAAVQADTGAIGDNVRAKTAQLLLDNGVFEMAKKLGISAKLATDAALGQKDAIKQVNAELEANERKLASANSTGRGAQVTTAGLRGESDKLRESLSAQSDDIGNSVKDYQTLQEALSTTTGATAAQQSAVDRLAAGAGVSTAAYLKAVSAQVDTKAQLEATTASMYVQGDAAGLLRQSLDLLNGDTLNAEQAQNQFDSQLANMADHMNAAGKEIDRANSKLTGNTAAAVANRGELISLTQAAQNNAEAYRQNGASTEQTRSKLIAMKKSIIENAVAHGEDRKAVEEYVDSIFKIPAKIPKTKIEVEDDAAKKKIRDLKALIASIPSRVGLTFDATGTVHYSDSKNEHEEGHADGGTVTGVGTTTSDSNSRRLSIDEEVTKASRATRYRPLLKALNNGTTAQIAAVAAPLVAPYAAAQQSGPATVWNVSQYYPVHSDPATDVRNLSQLQNAGAAS